MRSAFSVFPECATMYQGVNNNFMFECLEGANCAMWEEAMFASAQQESIKLLPERAPMSVAGKNRKNVQIDRVPIGITCNVLPWRSLRIQAHMKAFENRSIVLKCDPMPHLEEYANRGRINPRAWLLLGTLYWQKINAPEETEEEEVYFSDSGDEALSEIPEYR